jgi:hypothetical protein
MPCPNNGGKKMKYVSPIKWPPEVEAAEGNGGKALFLRMFAGYADWFLEGIENESYST